MILTQKIKYIENYNKDTFKSLIENYNILTAKFSIVINASYLNDNLKALDKTIDNKIMYSVKLDNDGIMIFNKSKLFIKVRYSELSKYWLADPLELVLSDKSVIKIMYCINETIIDKMNNLFPYIMITKNNSAGGYAGYDYIYCNSDKKPYEGKEFKASIDFGDSMLEPEDITVNKIYSNHFSFKRNGNSGYLKSEYGLLYPRKVWDILLSIKNNGI